MSRLIRQAVPLAGTHGPAASPQPRRPATLSLALEPAAAASSEELWAGLYLPGISAAMLPELARRAQRFTPRVSLEPPDGLLLEVRGSLELFGGTSALAEALQSRCARLQLQAHLALAPTPLAALAAARAGRDFTVTTRAQLTGGLAPLPLATLRWPPPLLERLKRLGVRTVGAALRLPRAGFARRFGRAALDDLDRLTGRVREVRAPFQAPECFRGRRELAAELADHAQLLHELGVLLGELEAFLEPRQLGVMRLECRLLHRQGAVTPCELKLAAPAADAGELAALLTETLRRLELPQPVRALELHAPTLLPLTPLVPALWQPGEHGGGASPQSQWLIERLRAHLGEAAIHGLALLDDHRPESAWTLAPPPAASGRGRARAPAAAGAPRPLWLLKAPQPLSERAGLPRRRGALRLVSEPERIEGGWWDGRDVARDYYTALDAHGVRLWVFRERRAPHGWFLHGLFG